MDFKHTDCSSVINDNGKDFQFYSSPQRIKLREMWRQEESQLDSGSNPGLSPNLWNHSKIKHDTSKYYVSAFTKYKPNSKAKKSNIHEVKDTQMKTIELDKDNAGENEHVRKMCKDFDMLLNSGSKADLTIYAKDERPIKCHILVLFARCKKILEDVVQQKNEQGYEEAVICWNSFEYSVVYKFLTYIYTGKPPKDIKHKKNWDQHKELSKSYGMLEYLKYIEAYDKTNLANDIEENNTSSNPGEITGGFVECIPSYENDALITEVGDPQFVGGVTQNLGTLLRAFDSNISTPELEDMTINELNKSEVSLKGKDEDEDEWQDVHAYFTQKILSVSNSKEHDFRTTDTTSFYETPEKSSNSCNGVSQAGNTTTQEFRAESPDMFADEDEVIIPSNPTTFYEKPNKRKSDHISGLTPSALKRTKLFDDPPLKDPSSELENPIDDTADKECSMLRSSYSDYDLPSPIPKTSLMDEKNIYDKKEIELVFNLNQLCAKTSESKQEIECDLETPKLSTPLDFSDNEDFNDIIIETEQDILTEKSASSGSVLLETALPCTVPTSPIPEIGLDDSPPKMAGMSKENILISRILDIRSQLKTPNASNDKTVEILLQELLSIQHMTINVLLKTGIGKTVKSLGIDHSKGAIKRKADLLVSRWTLLINQHAEMEEHGKTNTPKVLCTPTKRESNIQVDITPRPNYESMLTPAVNKELKKYGVRNMSKSKAIPLLDHIYEETHPVLKMLKKRTDKIEEELNESLDSTSSFNNDDNPVQELMEESILLTNNQFDHVPNECSQSSQHQDGDLSLRDLIIKFIQNDRVLHRQCLTYEPIWLEQFFSDFKAYAIAQNVKARQVKLNLVTDILDNECITFRTGARANRNRVLNDKVRKSKHGVAGTNTKRKQSKKRLSSSQTVKATVRKPSVKRISATQTA